MGLVLTTSLGSGCASTGKVQPLSATSPLIATNDRPWRPNLATLARAEQRGDTFRVRNIRNCTYLSADDYVVHHYNRKYDLTDLQSVDFILVPFPGMPSLAHTMFSFGFRGGQYLVVSPEVRLEVGEVYSPWNGALRQYELMYVVGDERDLVGLRTNVRRNDVYVYRLELTREECRQLFASVMQRVNQLAEQPEFYDTLANNCATNVMRHLNEVRPGLPIWDSRVLLPGSSDQLLYELGLIDTSRPLADLRRQANVAERARQLADRRDFSEAIRR